MANIYSPSFLHDSNNAFDSNDYSITGSLITVNTDNLIHGNGGSFNQNQYSESAIYSYKTQTPFNNKLEVILNQTKEDDSDNYSPEGRIKIFDINDINNYFSIEFWRNDSFVEDYRIDVRLDIMQNGATYTINIVSDYSVDPDLNTGDLKLIIDIGSDNGDGTADITATFYCQNTDETYTETFTYDFASYTNGAKFEVIQSGEGSDYLITKKIDLDDGNLIEFESITSQENFNTPTIQKHIHPNGIDSQENFNTPKLNFKFNINSIISQENFNAPILNFEFNTNGIVTDENTGIIEFIKEEVKFNPFIKYPLQITNNMIDKYVGGWEGKALCDEVYVSLQRLDNGLWFKNSPPYWYNTQQWVIYSDVHDNSNEKFIINKNNHDEMFPDFSKGVFYRLWIGLKNSILFETWSKDFLYQTNKLKSKFTGDIKIYFGFGKSELKMDDYDLSRTGGFENAILISLFTDKRITENEKSPNNKKGGWFGDNINTIPLGSKLWTLERSKNINDIRLKSQEYVKDSLQWLINNKSVKDIIVNSFIVNNNTLKLEIKIFKNDNNNEFFKYYYNWKEQSFNYLNGDY